MRKQHECYRVLWNRQITREDCAPSGNLYLSHLFFFVLLLLMLLLLLVKERRSLVRQVCGANWKPPLLVALRSSGQQLAHVVVARLGKVFVILADSLKERRRAQADGFIGLLCKFLAGVWRSYRHCHNDF